MSAVVVISHTWKWKARVRGRFCRTIVLSTTWHLKREDDAKCGPPKKKDERGREEERKRRKKEKKKKGGRKQT